ncbi:MAG TPA: hypothetical protein VNA25_02945, partial [Phycisphaerae bacterium]|nr:hypothetical protein [Phycisphaerae bacterium]
MRKLVWTAVVLALTAGCATAMTPVVVSNTYQNLDGEHGLSDVPVTFSRIGAEGDFTNGITPMIEGRKLPAQVNVLRRAADGSIRHALVSFVLPELAADGQVKIDWLDEPPAEPPAFRWGFQKEKFEARLVLSPERGEPIVSDVGKIIAGKWAASDRVKVLYDGPVMKEFEVHDVPVDAAGRPDPHLDVYWRLRAFTGQASVRVEAVVERCKDRKKSGPEPVQYKFGGVRLLSGEQVLYEEGAYDHLDQTRYRILVWTAGQLEDIHRRPNYEYWWKGKFVPRYQWVEQQTPAAVDQTYTAKVQGRNDDVRRQGILEPGIIFDHMPGAASRWDIGAYPAWSVAYLLSGAPGTYERMLHADGNGGGAFYIHVRQDGAPGYNVFTVEQPVQDQNYRVPLYTLPDGSRNTKQPDHAHAPSIGYISYLLTGDKYYAEEMSFWASYQMGEWPHKGLPWEQMARSFAWSLRHVVDAAFILPDDHPLLEYFRTGVDECLDEMAEQLVNSGKRVHSPPEAVFQCSGRLDWINCTRCSTWMYAWVVWSLANAADKGFEKAARVRDWAAEYIVGFYTSKDEYEAPDGRVYRYDPRDAMPYSTAVALYEHEIVTDKNG